jgi:hypothetical protein
MSLTDRQPLVEYAALSRRTEARAVIDRLARQRLEYLEDRALVFGLDHAEAAELAYLRGLAGTGPPAPAVPIKDGGCCEPADNRMAGGASEYRRLGAVTGQRRSRRQAQLATLAARWPAPRLTTQQRICQLWEARILFDMSPRQRAVWRMRSPWA